MFKKYGIIAILTGFVILAFTGIFFNFSIPHSVGDETVLTAAALKMIGEGSLRPAYPTNYHMPIGVYIYLPFFIVALAFLRLSGIFSSFEELRSFGILDYGKLLPIARLISVIFGAVSVYLVYRICQKLFRSTFVALFASFLLATNVIFLDLSHFGKVWILQIFTILLAFNIIVDFFQREQPSFKDYFKSALAIGASFGTHFIGVIVYVPFLVVHFLKNKGKRFSEIFIGNKNLWFANGVVIFVILLVFYLNPYGFINYAGHSLNSASGAITQSLDTEGTHYDFWRGISFYWNILFEFSPALLAIFLVSLIPLFRYRRDIFFVLTSFLAGYYLVIGPLLGSSSRPVGIYAIPFIPFMAIVAAYGIFHFYEHYSNRFFTKPIKIFILSVLGFFSLYLPVLWDYTLLKPSTYLLARNWIYAVVPPGAKILDFQADLPLNENKKTVNDIKKYAPASLTKDRAYLLSTNEIDYPRPSYYVLTPSLYRDTRPPEVFDQSFDYAIVGWFSGGREKALEEARPYGVREENLVQVFPADASPDDYSESIEAVRNPFFNLRKMTHIGPVIAIYKLQK